MKTKSFINLDIVQDEVLDLVQKEFLKTQFYGDKIELKIDLKDFINNKIIEAGVEEPAVYITTDAYQKVMTLIQNFKTEVAWHGLVEHMPGTRSYIIYDVLVFPQEVTGTTADGIDGEYEQWLATLPDEQFEKCRSHGHSHVNMGTTPSGTDENYYANLMTQVTDYYITIIVNKKQDYHLRFYDKENNIVYTDLPLLVCLEDGTTTDLWYDSIKEAVKEPKPVTAAKQTSLLDKYDDYDWYTSLYEEYKYHPKNKNKTTNSKKKGNKL